MKIFNFKISIFIMALIFGLYYSLPSFLDTKSGTKISLGLDLQGGLHMLLGVKTEEAIKSKIKTIASSVKHFGERNDILIDELTFDDDSVHFLVLDSDEIAKYKSYLTEIVEGSVITVDGEKISLNLAEKEILKTKKTQSHKR